MILDNIEIILVEPRFPENIGMVARACANMGCNKIKLVNPENSDFDKAGKTATAKGVSLLESIEVFSDLSSALANCNRAWATSARIGGWRKKIYNPAKAAEMIAPELNEGVKTAIVLGNEKHGLSNEDIQLCSHLVHIPTYGSLSSLNLAQACLIMLYECAQSISNLQKSSLKKSKPANEFYLSHLEYILLEKKLKSVLNNLHCCQGKNPDYHFIQWHNMLARLNLRRHEFDAWMGFCRQIDNMINNKNSV